MMTKNLPLWGLSYGILCYLEVVSGGSRRRQWHPTPVLLPGKSHGWRSLVGCSPWGCEELDTTERLHFHFSLSCIGEGNGNPLQCSCLENPRDGGAWWAAVYGVAQSRTRLKRLSSSSDENQRRLKAVRCRHRGSLLGLLLCKHAAVCLFHVIILAAAIHGRKASQRSPSSTPSKFHHQPYFLLAVKTPSRNLLVSKLVGVPLNL